VDINLQKQYDLMTGLAAAGRSPRRLRQRDVSHRSHATRRLLSFWKEDIT
jgi:hypothetical protein